MMHFKDSVDSVAIIVLPSILDLIRLSIGILPIEFAIVLIFDRTRVITE